MNKYIYSIIALIMIILCPAQRFVSQAEYFWDTDPGAGNGIAVSATDGSFNSAFEQLTKTGISTPGSGLHKLSIRIKDDSGVWGPVFTNVINVQQNTGSSVMAISQAEYFWDTDPGVGNGTAVLAADGNFDSSFEQLTKTGITLPTSGLHVFNIRIKDNTGVWGPVFKNVINVETQVPSGCWESISVGGYYSAGIKADGTLWAWGNNRYGQLGDGTTVNRNAPLQIGTESNWWKIATGKTYTLGIKLDGTLWAWGRNDYGQLGDGTQIDKLLPTQIGTATNWKHISTTDTHTVAIRTDGTLWAWGNNGAGALGDGTTIPRYIPTQIGTATDWESISAGSLYTLAIKSNGTLWAWGYNGSHELGDGTSTFRTSPVQIGTATNWRSIDAGDGHSVGIKTDGTLWTWGGNSVGQLGNGTTSSVVIPTQIGTETDWLNVSAGNFSTFATKINGTLWSWGRNSFGQLGNGTNVNGNTTSPTQVGTSSDNGLVLSGYNSAFVKTFDGFLKVCGNNANGQLGDGTNNNKNTFDLISCPTNCLSPVQFSTTNITSTTATINWIAPNPAPNGGYLYLYSTNSIIGGIEENTLSTTANLTNLLPGTTYYWWVASNCGSSQNNWVLGGSFTTLPTTETGCWQSVSSGLDHSGGIKLDGTLWTWGSNLYGQLGLGASSLSENAPKQVGTDNNWQKIATGDYHSVGLKKDGTLWTWGINNSGQLGNGTVTSSFTPIQIGTATNWRSIDAGGGTSVGIKTDGTLWAWGNNGYGKLGDGTYTNKLTPVQIGTATNWESIATGSNFTLAIKTDGTLWAWGRNSTGQLGDGTEIDRNIPVKIGTATNWKSINGGGSHSIGLKTDGTLWAWGSNNFGQLGNGTFSYTNSTNTPTQIGLSTNWRSIDVSSEGSNIAVKTDGTLWAWGNNEGGRLGDGTLTNRYSPTLIGSATDRQSIAIGRVAFVIDNNGFLSGSGYNSTGQLGDNTNIQKTIFVPITCPTSNLAVQEISTKADNLKVYPNPVRDILMVSYDQKILSVTIYNATGQLMLTKAINDNKGAIDVSGFVSGVYLVQVTAANNFVKTVKVIKQ